MQLIYTREPYERVAINIITPLPKTDRKNRNILTVVDHFTKHVEEYSSANQKVTTVARVFFNKFFLSVWRSQRAAHWSIRKLWIKFVLRALSNAQYQEDADYFVPSTMRQTSGAN